MSNNSTQGVANEYPIVTEWAGASHVRCRTGSETEGRVDAQTGNNWNLEYLVRAAGHDRHGQERE